jgi:hypothetical protein
MRSHLRTSLIMMTMTRLPLLLVLLLPLLAAADAAAPYLRLEGLMERNQGIDELAGWGEDRLIDGIGWKIATAARGDDDGGLKGYGRRGYTVISPQRGDPKPLRHMYVLGAFDLLPDKYLLVTIRDPELYWPDYDYSLTTTANVIEAVWYDKDWTELFREVLEFEPTDYPDDFRLSADGKYLLCIVHPVTDSNAQQLKREGQRLVSVRLKDGALRDVPFPDTEAGVAPADWWPVLMQWNRDDDLLVQAGDTLRRYSVHVP